MDTKYLDLAGLEYYDGKIKGYVTTEMNEALAEALAKFSSALIFKGFITEDTNLDSATTYTSAEVGHTYIVNKSGGGKVTVIYTNAAGTQVTEVLESGDTLICLEKKVGTTNAHWGVLQVNWSVQNGGATFTPGSTVTIGTVGGINLTLEIPTAVNLRSALGLGGAALKGVAEAISADSTNATVPTSLAVQNRVTAAIGVAIESSDTDHGVTVALGGQVGRPTVDVTVAPATVKSSLSLGAAADKGVVTAINATASSRTDNNLPTEKAVGTYVDNKLSEEIDAEDVTDGIGVTIGGSLSALSVDVGVNTVQLSTALGLGAAAKKDVVTTINATAANRTDNSLPTEKAVGSYVDSKVSAGITNVAYDTTNKKITKTVNGSVFDVVTAATLKTDMALNNVGNFLAVSTVASQGLTDAQKTNARANLGLGNAALATTTAAQADIVSAGTKLPTSGAVYDHVDGRLADLQSSLENYVYNGYKLKQTAKTSPTASGNTTSFIDTISQDVQGVITATKKTIPNASASAAGLMSAAHYSKLAGITEISNTEIDALFEEE